MTLYNADAHDYLCDTYDMDALNDIAKYGCMSGAAHDHIYYTDTVEFFDQYEERIMDDFEMIFGESIMDAAVKAGMDTIQSIKNWCTWWFIEEYAVNAVLCNE
jgi:lipopolysaccharide biosynthesis protein|tara:strand:+ start:251 stop:559 length:309 start_codon:yes stop_codon:yes gene_type:complete